MVGLNLVSRKKVGMGKWCFQKEWKRRRVMDNVYFADLRESSGHFAAVEWRLSKILGAPHNFY